MHSDCERWFVGRTLARKERLAQENLERQGFGVFFPTLLAARRHARKIDQVKTPLFPGYLFIRLDPQRDRWRSINGTKGVSHLLTNNEQPCPIATRIVEDLQAVVGPDGCIELDPRLQTGDLVRICSGSFSGQVGELLRLDGRKRVEVLLSLLGCAVRVEMDRGWLECASK